MIVILRHDAVAIGVRLTLCQNDILFILGTSIEDFDEIFIAR